MFGRVVLILCALVFSDLVRNCAPPWSAAAARRLVPILSYRGQSGAGPPHSREVHNSADYSFNSSVAKQLAVSAVTIRRRAVLQGASGTDKSLMRLSADGQLLATGTGRGSVKLWDTRNGQVIADLAGTEGQSPRDFSPVDDRLLASANLKSVSLYDLKAMKLKSYVDLEKVLGSMNFFEAFSPNGELFLMDSVGKSKVTVWETKTARIIASRPCRDPLFHSTFSQDSKTVLTSCGDRKATLWDAQTGDTVSEFSNPENVLISVFNPDQKTIATVTINSQVMIWDAGTGRVKTAWPGSGDSIYNAKFSPDTKILVTLSWNGTATVWDVENQKQKHKLRVSRSATSIAFSPDSRFVMANGHAGEVSVWNVADGSEAFTITGHQKDVDSGEFSSDSRLLVTSSADAVNVWDVTAKVLLARLDDARFPAHFSGDGKTLITGGTQNTLIVWDVTQ